jgi:hypothetical protein
LPRGLGVLTYLVGWTRLVCVVCVVSGFGV